MGFCGRNFKNLSLVSEQPPLRQYVDRFLQKTDKFHFLGLNLPENEFWVWNFKNLNFLQLAQKLIFGLEFQKCKCGFGINIIQILCAPISTRKGKLSTFGLKVYLNGVLALKFQITKSGFSISILEILCGMRFTKNKQG